MSTGPEIVITPDAEAASAEAAARIAGGLQAAIEARGVAHWVTTGGSTPIGVYRALRASHLDAVDWSRVHVWWTDDRYVPSEHPLSNVQAFDEIALAFAGHSGLSGTGEQGIDFRGHMPGLPIRAEHVHRIPMAEAIGRAGGPEWAAARYEEALRDVMPLGEEGVPVFDVILIGVGGDGHLFSVFPGSAVWDDPAWVQGVAAPTHIEPHVARVTLHPAVIGASRLPLVVVLGEDKAEMLARILGPGDDVRELPARVARRPGATWILDAAAASQLPPAGAA